jgi:hypothetical protein
LLLLALWLYIAMAIAIWLNGSVALWLWLYGAMPLWFCGYIAVCEVRRLACLVRLAQRVVVLSGSDPEFQQVLAVCSAVQSLQCSAVQCGAVQCSVLAHC